MKATMGTPQNRLNSLERQPGRVGGNGGGRRKKKRKKV